MECCLLQMDSLCLQKIGKQANQQFYNSDSGSHGRFGMSGIDCGQNSYDKGTSSLLVKRRSLVHNPSVSALVKSFVLTLLSKFVNVFVVNKSYICIISSISWWVARGIAMRLQIILVTLQPEYTHSV